MSLELPFFWDIEKKKWVSDNQFIIIIRSGLQKISAAILSTLDKILELDVFSIPSSG